MKKKYKLIIFDMDGTLYDLNDVVLSNYEIQCSFLESKEGLSRNEVDKLFSQNHIYPTIRDDSKSCTEFFTRRGYEKKEWNNYREKNFNVDAISSSKAINQRYLDSLSQHFLLCLLTSSSSSMMMKILNHLRINPKVFSEIITNDSDYIDGIFNKLEAMKCLLKKYNLNPTEVLSIGDRFETDILPCLSLGGDGILIYNLKAMDTIVNDIYNNSFSNDGYKFFKEII